MSAGDSKTVEPRSRPNRPRFWLAMGVFVLTVALAGFAKTFFAPLVTGAFHGPIVVYIHGFFAFSWVTLFAVQPWLVHAGNIRLHRRLYQPP